MASHLHQSINLMLMTGQKMADFVQFVNAGMDVLDRRCTKSFFPGCQVVAKYLYT